MTESESARKGRVVGLVLAGGASRRFPHAGGKAWAKLAGRPLLHHVMDRLTPQVAELWLSLSAASRGEAENPWPEVTIIRDRTPRLRGPLAGLASGLERLESEDWLVMAPCDTPFLPEDIVQRLLVGARDGDQVVVAADAARVHPACSAWRAGAAPAVERALASPSGPGLMALLRELPHSRVRWPDAIPPPFHNVNSPADLEAAAAWLGPAPVGALES